MVYDFIVPADYKTEALSLCTDDDATGGSEKTIPTATSLVFRTCAYFLSSSDVTEDGLWRYGLMRVLLQETK